MKKNKLSFIIILIAVTAVLYIAATFGFCYVTKPEVKSGEFPFSITYEYKGETKTFSGVMKCEFDGSGTIHLEHKRYWTPDTVYDNPCVYDIPNIIDQSEQDQTSLAIYENMEAGYFMGDPLYDDYYQQFGLEGAEPRIEYYDYKNGIELTDENRDEVLASIGFKIVDFTYAEPIENSFSLAGVRYEADNLAIFLLISILFFVLCLIFVRKDIEHRRTALDKIGIILNFVIGLGVIPFVTVLCFFFGIVESDVSAVNQLIYNIPPISVICMGLSVALRRKGYSKASFFFQFGGLVPALIAVILEAIF